jgi:hypothetical protein
MHAQVYKYLLKRDCVKARDHVAILYQTLSGRIHRPGSFALRQLGDVKEHLLL